MTDQKRIQQIKESQKAPMTFDDYSNYFFFIFPLAFIAMGLSLVYNYFKFHTELTILLASVFLLALGSFIFYFTTKRLRENITFERVDMKANETIESIVEKIKINFKLRGIDFDKELGLIVAYTKWTGLSWGEKLTLIIDKKSILINSRPTGVRQPVTIYKDKENIFRLKEIIAQ